MIEFIKDVDLGEGVTIKKGMVADYWGGGMIHTLAGSVFMPDRIGFSLFMHPEWNEFLKVPDGAMAIFDFDSQKITPDCYRMVGEECCETCEHSHEVKICFSKSLVCDTAESQRYSPGYRHGKVNTVKRGFKCPVYARRKDATVHHPDNQAGSDTPEG
jgi:hypothetical protein